MKITFFGTAAANAYPEPFCSCANCVEARALGGRSLRKRSAALINDDLLIDFGPDVLTAAMQHGCEFTRVRYCLQTHAHADHLDTSHFLSRSPGYGVVGAPRLEFYASAGSLRVAAELLARDCVPDDLFAPQTSEKLNLTLHRVQAGEQFQCGSYRVTVCTANHDPFVEPLLYAIEQNGRTIFYGTDTAEFPADTWRVFRQYQLRFDLVVLDHTFGLNKNGAGHLTTAKFLAQLQRLREENLVTAHARFLATHIAHDANPVHPKLVEFAARQGYEVAYDGLTIEI